MTSNCPLSLLPPLVWAVIFAALRIGSSCAGATIFLSVSRHPFGPPRNMRQTFCQRKDKRINCPQDFNTDMEQEIMALRQTGCSLHKLVSC